MSSGGRTKLIQTMLNRVARGFFALPDGLLKMLFGSPPPEAEGLRTDAWVVAKLTAPLEKGEAELDPNETRKETDFLAGVVGLEPTGVTESDWVLEGEDRSLNARLFTPEADSMAGPMLVHFHGGGWVQGSIESHTKSCARLAREAGIRVLSVEYRLAPEHPFPAQAEDALLAWRSVMSDPARFGADPARVGVSGDSAGGHMATVLCLDLKAAEEPQPACQVLIYPVADCSGSFPSREIFSSGYYLTSARIRWFEDCFVPDGVDTKDPRLSPVFSEDLSGLAPAYVSIALVDPLRDEGLAYAEGLANAGVEVTTDVMPMLHAWFNLTVTRSARQGHEVLARRVNELLG